MATVTNRGGYHHASKKYGNRYPLSSEAFSGRVVDWKGTYGWIESLEPIDHPDANRHHGRIFVHQDDVAVRKQLRKGVICEFELYQDSQGLGAQNVVSRQVVRLLLPIVEGKRIFADDGSRVPDFEDRHHVSLRAFEWYNTDGTPGMLPFLVEVWGRPGNIVSAILELKKSVYCNLDFLVPQSRFWMLDVQKLHKQSGCTFQISNLTAIDDPMPCYPLTCNGTDEELGNAVLALIDQICDPN